MALGAGRAGDRSVKDFVLRSRLIVRQLPGGHLLSHPHDARARMLSTIYALSRFVNPNMTLMGYTASEVN